MNRIALVLATAALLVAGQVNAQINFKDSGIQGRTIAIDDLIVGFDADGSGASAARADSLKEVIKTIFTNPPGDLTTDQKTAILTAIGAPSSVIASDVDVSVSFISTYGQFRDLDENAAGVNIVVAHNDITNANPPVSIRDGDILVLDSINNAYTRVFEGTGKWATKAEAKTIADASANTAVTNGVQVPARASPGNEISGVRQYFEADFYAPDSEHDEVLKAHRNGSTYWDAESGFPALMQVSPGFVDKNNVPDRFQVTIHTELQAFPNATKIRLTLFGVSSVITYSPTAIEHSTNIFVTSPMLTAIAALSTTGTGSVTELTAIPLDKDDRITGPNVIPGVALQVIAGASGGSGGSTELTKAQEIALLTFIPEPAVISFSSQTAFEAAVRSVRLQIPNPELLTGDVWYEGQIQGQPALTRTKWTSSTSALTLSVNASVGNSIAQGIATDSELEVRIRFYDAASAGNEIERIGVNIPLVDQKLSAEFDARNPTALTTIPFSSILALDWNAAAGPMRSVTLTGNMTITFSNVSVGDVMVLEVIQDSTGGRTISWPSSVEWAGGSAIGPSSTGGAVDIYTLLVLSTTRVVATALLEVS